MADIVSRLCSVEGCGRDHLAQSYCSLHYQRWRHGVSFDKPVKGTPRICSVDGCSRARDRAEFCTAHAARVKRGQPLDTPIKPRMDPKRFCSVEGCGRIHKTKGYCRVHYGPYRPKVKRICAVPDCGRSHNAKGLCGAHSKMQAKGQTLRPIGFARRHITHGGYVIVRVPGGYQLEHRQIMEQTIGRPLYQHENVHHINGDKVDNRIENLELWSTSHPSGQRIVDKIKWIRDFAADYGLTVTGQAPLLP